MHEAIPYCMFRYPTKYSRGQGILVKMIKNVSGGWQPLKKQKKNKKNLNVHVTRPLCCHSMEKTCVKVLKIVFRISLE